MNRRMGRMVRCSNCGTSWFLERSLSGQGDDEQSDAVCPVCHFGSGESQPALAPVESIADLENQLDVLVRRALESGLAADAIVDVLRSELAFAAELGHAGRRFAVQLIDLGPWEGELMQRPLRDPRDTASHRGDA
jgi:hypothetical protein